MSDSDIKNFVRFSEILKKCVTKSALNKRGYDIDQMAMNLLLESLDPHSSFMWADEYKELKADMRSGFGAIGIEMTIQKDVLTVVSPIENTPASQAGIKAGDQIIMIDGQSTKGITLSEAVKKLRGKISTIITLTIIREAIDKPMDFVMTRDVIKIKNVKSEVLNKNIGYIRISSFPESTAENLKKTLQDLTKKSHPLKGLILDMRNNPGGLLIEAIEVSEIFLKSGTIVSTRGRAKNMESKTSARNDGNEPICPMVILVNGETGGGAEIVAGALQDNMRALIIGTQTFGDGLMQTGIPLEDGSFLKLTTAKYYTPKGKVLQGVGITPNVIIGKIKDIREKDIQSINKLDFPKTDTISRDDSVNDGERQLQESIRLLETVIVANDMVKGLQDYQKRASAHQLTVPSTSSVSLRPTGEGWVLVRVAGPNIMFKKQTYKGMYHSVVALAEFPQIDEIIVNPSGTRRDIGNIVELLQYVKKITKPESQEERFKKANVESSIVNDLGCDCVRVDYTGEDHGVPGASVLTFILKGRDYYCLHPTSTESDVRVIHLSINQRYLRGEEPFLLDAEIDPFFRSYIEGSTLPMIKASKKGDLAGVQKLVVSGIDVNMKADVISDMGKTALMEASLRGYVDIVTALLKAGSDVNAKDNYGDTALMFASAKGHYDIVKLLLSAGAAVNVQTTGSGCSTALIMASKNANAGVVQLLLDAGAEVNIKEQEGGTALLAALWKGDIAIIEALIEKGADVNARDARGITALMYAVDNGHGSIVNKLIEKGANVNAKDAYGHTPLDFAKSKGQIEIIELLIKAGAKE